MVARMMVTEQLFRWKLNTLLTHSYHCGYHNCSMAVDTLVPRLRYDCDNCVGTVVSTGIVTVVP